MKRITKYFALTAAFLMLLSGCGKSMKSQLADSWYREGRDEPMFVLYDDGTCKIANEYGTGRWAIVNDNQLRLTNYYGETELATIEEVSGGKLTLSSGDNSITLVNKPSEDK